MCGLERRGKGNNHKTSLINRNLLYDCRKLNLGPCDILEGWDAVQGRREFQEGGNMFILMADSHFCRAENNTTL